MQLQRQNRLQGFLSRCPPSGTTVLSRGHVPSLPTTHSQRLGEVQGRKQDWGWGSPGCHPPLLTHRVQAALPRELGAKAARRRGQRWAGRASRTGLQPRPELRRPRRQPGTLPGHGAPAQPTAEDTWPGSGGARVPGASPGQSAAGCTFPGHTSPGAAASVVPCFQFQKGSFPQSWSQHPPSEPQLERR